MLIDFSPVQFITSQHSRCFIPAITKLCVTSSRSLGVEARLVSAFMGQSKCLCFPTIHSSETNVVESDTFDGAFHNPGSPFLASRKSGFVDLWFWWKNHLSSPGCGTCWFNFASRSFTEACTFFSFMHGNCERRLFAHRDTTIFLF